MERKARMYGCIGDININSTNNKQVQCNLGSFLGLGAHVMISSTLMIISAASLAEIRACSFER